MFFSFIVKIEDFKLYQNITFCVPDEESAVSVLSCLCHLFWNQSIWGAQKQCAGFMVRADFEIENKKLGGGAGG